MRKTIGILVAGLILGASGASAEVSASRSGWSSAQNPEGVAQRSGWSSAQTEAHLAQRSGWSSAQGQVEHVAHQTGEEGSPNLLDSGAASNENSDSLLARILAPLVNALMTDGLDQAPSDGELEVLATVPTRFNVENFDLKQEPVPGPLNNAGPPKTKRKGLPLVEEKP